MRLNLTCLVALFLISVVVDCANLDLEVKKNAHDDSGSETTTKPGANTESKRVDPDSLKKNKVPNDIQNGSKSVPGKESKDEEASGVQKGSKDKDLVDNVENKPKANERSGSDDVLKEPNLSSTGKGSFGGEQCDSSFKCTIVDGESHGLIACLSVPGDESTEVSLLIQYKGKGQLDVDIKAPDCVHLDKTKIQIQENDDQKVMVSLKDGKIEKFITLKTREGSCSLDFMDFLTHNPMKKSNNMSRLTYTNLFRQTPFLGLLSLALILVTVSVAVCVTYQKRRFLNTGAKYQKLDAELPVSSNGPKVDLVHKDGWDETWSDDWDDVEAPSTPSMPLTPSISSGGVSSRRVNKDGWKD